MLKNSALAAGSILAVLLLTVAADRVLGSLFHGFQPPDRMELIFPPLSEKSFDMLDFRYDVHINKLGLRDGDIGPKRPDVYRIAAIGDSFTYGWGVDIAQSWPKVLEQLLRASGRQIEVINCGKPGAGPPFYADLAERAIPVLQPDLVIVAPLQDDIGEAMPNGVAPTLSKRGIIDRVRWLYPNLVRFVRTRKAVPVKSGAVSAPERISIQENRRVNADAAKGVLGQMTPEQRARFDQLEERVRTAFNEGRLNPYIIDLSIVKSTDYYEFLLKSDDAYIMQCTQSMGEQFRRIADAAALYGARLMVAPVPLGPYVNLEANRNMARVGFKTALEMIDAGNPDLVFERAAQQAGCRFLSVTAKFKEQKAQTGLYYELDGHFTPAGQKLFAESLASLLAPDLN